MLPDSIKNQTVAIRRSLSSHGWSVVEVEQPFEDEWWAAEIWRIEWHGRPRVFVPTSPFSLIQREEETTCGLSVL